MESIGERKHILAESPSRGSCRRLGLSELLGGRKGQQRIWQEHKRRESRYELLCVPVARLQSRQIRLDDVGEAKLLRLRSPKSPGPCAASRIDVDTRFREPKEEGNAEARRSSREPNERFEGDGWERCQRQSAGQSQGADGGQRGGNRWSCDTACKSRANSSSGRKTQAAK